jgi:site-specific recombinase XerD
VEAFVEHEQDRGLNITTVHNRLGCVKAFIRYLARHGGIDAPFALKDLCVKQPQTLPRAMDTRDVSQLLAALDDVRDRAMIMILLRTGMRIGELLNCKVSDLCLEQKQIRIYQGEKNHRGRCVCLSQDACQAVEHWLDQRDQRKEYLFYSTCRATLSYTSARSIFCSAVQKAGLSGKGYTLHCLRHSFATQMLNAGLPIDCLQQLLGHSTLEITQRYARLSDRTRQQEYFKAMDQIEKEAAHGSDRLDHPLQAKFEKEKLLAQHPAKLSEPSQALHSLAQPTAGAGG